jgi:hypothetical protein
VLLDTSSVYTRIGLQALVVSNFVIHELADMLLGAGQILMEKVM